MLCVAQTINGVVDFQVKISNVRKRVAAIIGSTTV